MRCSTPPHLATQIDSGPGCSLARVGSSCVSWQRVGQLEALDKAYEDPGPVYDVVTYKDAGNTWRVCVDTSESGNLAAGTLLAPFRVEQTYGTLDDASMCNYGVEVLAEGARTVLCVDAGSHGTHVAGIIGAHFPSQPELNGIAPGCQIIGFKIGDTRLDGMETGTALVRALGAAIERGVHVINLSFGEYANVDGAPPPVPWNRVPCSGPPLVVT